MSEWFDALWKVYTAHLDSIVPLATFFLQLATLIGAAFLAWAAWRQARAAWRQAETASRRHHEQTKADSERRITESFARAIEQLASDKLEIRLGGIYTLERIARESEREYWPIMETLTAYVRERAPWPPQQALTNPFVQLQGDIAGESTCAELRPVTDIAAVLAVLGRLSHQRKVDQGRWLDLSDSNLQHAFLDGANLQEAFLSRSNLGAALLEGANLQQAGLHKANLQAAFLQGANLQEAFLEEANLLGAILWGANLQKASLGGANLREAQLSGANLREARGLTQAQLDDAADGDDRTVLPEGLTRPAHWPKSAGNGGGD